MTADLIDLSDLGALRAAAAHEPIARQPTPAELAAIDAQIERWRRAPAPVALDAEDAAGRPGCECPACREAVISAIGLLILVVCIALVVFGLGAGAGPRP